MFKKSTRKVLKEHDIKNIEDFLHMYIYARWTDKYLGMARRFLPSLAKKNPRKIADNYHAKILTPDLAKKVISINKSIPLQDLEQIIPYPTARKIVLEHPLDIVVLDCPCRASAPNPCKPSMVCMIIGKPFTDFILEHRPDKSKRITKTEALELLEEVHKQGCVHSAYFKDVCLDRFYVICNCCKCCCLGIEAMMKHGVSMLASSGYTAKIEKDICVACGLCRKKCPFDAIAETFDTVEDKCMGCGVCVSQCHKNAISLYKNPIRGIPLDVGEIC